MLFGSLNPGLDFKVSRGHGLGTPPCSQHILYIKPFDKGEEDDYDFHANYQDYICDEDQELDSACSKKELVIDKTILLQRSATVGRIIIKGLESTLT